MKNENVIVLFNAGVQNATAHTLDVAHAYKVIKFRNVLKAAFDKIQKADEGFLGEVGIQDPQAFDTELHSLVDKEERTKADNARLKEMEETVIKLNGLRKALYDDEADFSEAKKMPWEQWFKFSCENKDIVKPAIEDMLCGILWEEPME